MVEKDFWGVLATTIPFWGDMNDNQRSALTSFGYNLGAHFQPARLVLAPLALFLLIGLGQKSPEPLMLYVNPGTPYEAGCADDASRRELWNT